MFAAHGSKIAAAAGMTMYVSILVRESGAKKKAAAAAALPDSPASIAAAAAASEANELRVLLASKEAEVTSAKAQAALQIQDGEALVAKGLALIADGRAALN